MMTAKRKTKKQSLSNNYCIVAFNVVAESYFENLSKSRLTLFIGTLVNINISLNEQLVAIKIVDLEKQYNVSEEELWLCPRDALLHVDKSVWPLLSAVPSPVERVFLLRENDLLDELLKIEVGSLVNVKNSDFDNEYSTAVVKFKGPILKKGPGVYFGVEILDGNCDGEYDGCFGNQRFFSCPPGTGKFVAINQLYPAHSYAHQSSCQSVQVENKREKMQKPSYSLTSNIHDYGGICDCERGLLKIGDRVVWLSDEGPVAGVVRRLACSDNSLKVSVQFDEPVRADEGAGECTRTAVLPALELVKASDFFGAPDVGKTNGETSWDNGDIDLKKSNDCLNRASQELSAQNSQYTVYEDGGVGAGSGSEGSGYYDTPEGDQVGVGSLVEVSVRGEPHYGVIRWVGTVPGDLRPRRIAGIEMEEELPGLGDGAFNGRRYFQCNPQKALFVNLNQCRRDSRFHENASSIRNHQKNEDFGFVDSPVIPGAIPPISREGDISSICGKFRGIQGHHNSCYLDATLFSMFTFTSVFDSLLYRPALPTDMVHYDQVQKVLREEIVNPLRVNLFVRADRVMKLRTLLEKLSSVSGLTTEEKDPEEFLTSLVAQILRAEPFLKLSSGQEAYHYQLFVEKDEALTFPTVQQLFEQSFLSSDLKLKEVPSCLIIQMPRFGKSFKMYPRILPSQLLDVTDVIEDSPRQCTVCGNLAEFECTQCFEQCDVGLQSISFCGICLETAHNHERRRNHSWKHLKVPLEFTIIKEHCLIPRLYMQLFAVVCIETSHYVTFVKCGTGADAPWCFFDSMADRKGEQNGYNIPELVACPDLPYWLSEKGAQVLHQIKDERQLPEHAKRLLCDAYMCMYQSTEVMMYR